jgi:hypothetical protein
MRHEFENLQKELCEGRSSALLGAVGGLRDAGA